MNAVGQLQGSQMKLKRIFIEVKLPKELAPLKELANNLWWSWNKDAIELFRSIAGEKWEDYGYNPVALLDNISPETIDRLMGDKGFMKQLKSVKKQFDAYMTVDKPTNSPAIAYFCMEYGLHTSLRLYSGGLGVLAGDFMKEASDCNVNMTAVGLLYRYGYFQQSLTLNGDQINNYPPQKFTKMPLHPVRNEKGEWQKISITLHGRRVYAKIWEVKIGRISLYLLDTDVDENQFDDRSLTHQLYGGDNEHRLKQELLLGVGGVRALKAMNKKPDVFHLNEGHASFSGLERLRILVQEEKLSFAEAVEVLRSTSLFTTHTPVPAGHDHFPEYLLKSYIHHYRHDLGIEWQTLLALGKVDVTNPNETFSMSNLAVRLSQEVNGVSELHGTVSQKMFQVLYPGYNSEETNIGFVTNGVHYPTWIANEWHELFNKTFGKNYLADQSNKDYWRKIQKVSSKKIMGIRKVLKKRLIDFMKERLHQDLLKRGENPRTIFSITNNIQEDTLIFGFARRFATYKRAHLLFTNLERLARIVNNPDKPVMFVFSGKAHPADQGGQALIKRIIDISKRPEFLGKIIFLENYNMESAKLLVQGVDVWLNTPTRPKEASGTSGMKAAMNGVVNFSVLDGWWAEGYRPDAGWSLPLERTYQDQALQNDLDAERIYNTLEYDIVPVFYNKNDKGISDKWVAYVKNIIAEVAPDFTMKRMMDHYFERFYTKLYERSKAVNADNFEMAKSLNHWKNIIKTYWNHIEVTNMEVLDTDNYSLPLGQAFKATIDLDLKGLAPDQVGVEVVFFQRKEKDELEVRLVQELEVTTSVNNHASYTCELPTTMSGVYEYGFRMFPKHKLLVHRMDFPLAKWL